MTGLSLRKWLLSLPLAALCLVGCGGGGGTDIASLIPLGPGTPPGGPGAGGTGTTTTGLYRITHRLCADYQQPDPTLNPGQVQTAVYKPHETVVDPTRGIWVCSNERGEEGQYKGGISLFDAGNQLLANLVIDEPAYDPNSAPNGFVYYDEALGAVSAVEQVEGAPERDPSIPPFIPSVQLPIVLPPGSALTPQGQDAYGRPVIYAPMGAEGHARHPHGIDMDRSRGLVYLLIEHSGLRWNQDRTDFLPARNTDEESGFTLVFDVSNPRQPRIVTGYLNGHGAHELAVNETNGWVFQGNHEDSPGVNPPNWVDVIDPGRANPYGFIDTGYDNAVQGIEVDETQNRVYGTTHVGQLMFAFDGNTWPTPNGQPTVDRKVGENAVLYTVNLRAAFDQQVAEAANIWQQAAVLDAQDQSQYPSVLHMHDLTVDPLHHKVYQTVHSIHHAEHTGRPEEVHVTEEDEEDDTEGPHAHFMGRWVIEVDADPASPNFKQASVIDLSNGVGPLQVANAEDPDASLLGLSSSGGFDKWFVHAHWVAVDPIRNTLLVSGEHTGNLGVYNLVTRQLMQVLPISQHLPGTPPIDETHVHGVQLDPLSGRVFVTDEGTHSSYESVTILDPY